MPITGPSSYVPTAEEFEQHWLSANTTLGVGNEVVLPDGTNQAGLTAQKNALITKQADVQARLNDKEVARGNLEVKKTALLERLVQFNDKIRAYFPDTKWIGALPIAPGLREGQSHITDPLDDVSHLWQQINADPATAAPVTLLGGYAQATLGTDLVALKVAYTTLNAAETTLKVTREERNNRQDEIYASMRSYRAVLPTLFDKDHALVVSLPKLSPAPGSTPDPVTLNGNWTDPPGYAALSWSASDDPNLDQYQLRMCIGPVYNTDTESVVANIPLEQTSTTTVAGLANPGDTASYKIYVLLVTGNQSGSNAVAITRV